MRKAILLGLAVLMLLTAIGVLGGLVALDRMASFWGHPVHRERLAPVTRQVWSDEGGLVLHSEPRLDGAGLARLPNGTLVEILGPVEGNFQRVRVPSLDGLEGWLQVNPLTVASVEKRNVGKP